MKLTKKKLTTVNNTLRKRDIHWDQRQHINCIRIHNTESREHFLGKCKVAYELHQIGVPFITEAWTTDRKKRYDLLELLNDFDYEFETGKSKKKYKGDIEVRV